MQRSFRAHAFAFHYNQCVKQSTYQRSWLSPGLTSHQLLDAGVAARQSASRKNIKKAQRPFANYFRTEYRCSHLTSSAMNRNGELSAYNAVRLMTDPKASWAPPWGRLKGRGLARTRNRRQDALEGAEPIFGEDELDKIIARLLELRFSWDREDGMMVTELVPGSMFGLSEHSLPCDGGEPSFCIQTPYAAVYPYHKGCRDEEFVMVGNTPVTIRNPTKSVKHSSKSLYQIDKKEGACRKIKWSLNGVNAIPSFVADIVRGPFLSSPHAAELSLRWKASNRLAKSVSEALQLHRKISAASVVGLPPRSALLLLFSIATMEIENPALEVSLGITMGENYNGYEMTECLELLRCLRRLAFVRNLPTMTTSSFLLPQIHSEDAVGGAPLLYRDASLTGFFFGAFVADTAPFLIAKVWERLPKHSERLLQRRFYMDWIDLLYLALEMNEDRLPDKLPNPVSTASYASKYLFLQHTLHIDESTMVDLAVAMRAGACADGVYGYLPSVETKSQYGSSESAKASTSDMAVRIHSPLGIPPANRVDCNEVHIPSFGQGHEKSLILWLSASLLVRLVSEALGDVLNHVCTYLQHSMQALISERIENVSSLPSCALSSLPETRVKRCKIGFYGRATTDQGSNIKGSTMPNGSLTMYLDRLMLYRPCVAAEATHLGRQRRKRIRVRLLPYESFPRLASSLPPPLRKVMHQAGLAEKSQMSQHEGASQGQWCSQSQSQGSSLDLPCIPMKESMTQRMPLTLGSFIAQCAVASQHIERAVEALTWSTMVLHHCLEMVRDLPPLKFRVSPSFSRLEERQVRCAKFAHAKIQVMMDQLFIHIPWEEIESNIEPLLASQQDGDIREQATDVEPSFLSHLVDDHLGLTYAEDPGNKSFMSSDEQRDRGLLKDLQKCVSQFELSVADLLEAYEFFFWT